MSHSIRDASRADIATLISVMNNGFRSDPLVRWALPDDKDFEEAHSAYVEIVAEPAFDCGSVHLCADGAGAAIWHPPGVKYDVLKLQEVAEKFSHLENLGGHFALVEACASHTPAESHWVLDLLSVNDQKRGHGVGTSLLAHGLEKCDLTGKPVYLESSNAANLSIYQRHGFELLAEVQLPGTPKRFPMLRPAAST